MTNPQDMDVKPGDNLQVRIAKALHHIDQESFCWEWKMSDAETLIAFAGLSEAEQSNG